jgi:catalase
LHSSAQSHGDTFSFINAANKRFWVQWRQIGHFTKADPAHGRGVAERLGPTTRLEAAE